MATADDAAEITARILPEMKTTLPSRDRRATT